MVEDATRPLAVEWMVLFVGLLVAVAASAWSVRSLWRGSSVGVVMHWGGLGVGATGWRASTSLVALLVALLAWFVFAALGLQTASNERAAIENAADRQAKVSALDAGAAGANATKPVASIAPPASASTTNSSGAPVRVSTADADTTGRDH